MTNKEVVLAFVDAWDRIAWDEVASYLAEDVAYHNIPWEPVNGRDTVMANLAAFGVQESYWKVHHIIAEGDLVMTERTDYSRNADRGGKWCRLRVMGIFRLRDGLITEWRDYFDSREFDDDFEAPVRD